MSSVHYMALKGIGGWSFAIQATGAQLKPYRDYLRTAMKAAERTKPKLAWREATREEAQVFHERLRERHAEKHRRESSLPRRRRLDTAEDLPDGRWVVLEAPPDCPEEPDDTFDAFLAAEEIYDHEACKKDAGIMKLDYDREGRALLLSELPESTETGGAENVGSTAANLVWLRSDTYALSRQLKAIEALDNAPSPRHAPLTRLMVTRPEWPGLEPKELAEADWVFLQDLSRDGTDEQRRWVQLTLATPDFALLEGPPGSGKTTAICELIVQLARQGKRVLLVASTHVAVDNVLERLLAWQDDAATSEKLVLPVRIGDEGRVTSDAVVPWCYHRLLRTWRNEIQSFLERPRDVDPRGNGARRLLLQAVREYSESPISNLLLESSNLVCGTTIGILQHPAIREAGKNGLSFEPFDVMILDEASKTTFSEFLVPALHASRWVVVGDIKQLSPYVEQQYMEDNLRGLLPLAQAEAAAQSFKAKKFARWLPVEDEGLRQFLVKETQARGLHLADLDAIAERELHGVPGAIPELFYADLIIGRPETLRRFQHRLPVDMVAGGQLDMQLEDWQAAHTAWLQTQKSIREHEEQNWEAEVAWRLVRSYELRQNEQEPDRYDDEIQGLLPRSLDEGWFAFRRFTSPQSENAKKTPAQLLQRELDNIRRCAFPSILELLQRGFERVSDRHEPVALTDGLPNYQLRQRLVSLSYQHRMHPHISAFPREQFYTQDTSSGLLHDARGMTERRNGEWTHARYKHRAVWVEVSPERGRRSRGNENLAEVKVVLAELKAFADWAVTHPRRDGKPWEAAALTFYRAQEKLLRDELQKLSLARGNTRNFKLPAGGSAVQVTLCTVDRFQGHEADLVLLSFVKSGPRPHDVGFLNSPSRLNVAITRSRYQLVLVGNRKFFEGCSSELLRSLASSPHYHRGIAY